MDKKFRCRGVLAALAAAVLAQAAAAETVKVKPGMRVAYNDDLVLEFGGECFDKSTPPQEYARVDGHACLRSTFDLTATSWSAPDGNMYTPANCKTERVLRPQIGVYQMESQRMVQHNYWSDYLGCKRGIEQEPEVTKTGQFGVYRGCPATLQIVKVQGTVSVDGQPVKGATRINARTELRTGPASRVEVEFPGGGMVRLGPDSRMAMECHSNREFDFNMQMRVFLGRVWFSLAGGRGPREHHETHTQRVVAGPRGTIYEVVEDAQQTRVLVEEGSVLVGRSANDPDAILIGPCQAARVADNSRPQRIAAFESPDIHCR